MSIQGEVFGRNNYTHYNKPTSLDRSGHPIRVEEPSVQLRRSSFIYGWTDNRLINEYELIRMKLSCLPRVKRDAIVDWYKSTKA